MSNVSNKNDERGVNGMREIRQDIKRVQQFLKGDCVVLTVQGDTLIVDAGNKSSEEVKALANTFFKHAYELPTK